MGEDRAKELLALSRVVEACRARAVESGLPALAYILCKAELSLSDHAVRAARPGIPRGPALSVPPGRITRH